MEHSAEVLAMGGTSDRQARLSAPERRLHQRVLRRFLETGIPPTAAWFGEAALACGLDGAAAAETLAQADLVHFAGERVSVSYPFSGVPTSHVVKIDGCRAVHAMCAVDALGMVPMVGAAGQIDSVDAHTGEPVRVTCADGRWTFLPDAAVMLVAATGSGTSSSCTCPYINFHVSKASADAFLAVNPNLTGAVLGQVEAVALGERLFGPLLRA
ncbi:alkylmercury lyase family protein [Actinokineospora guangxiensis]|uniref:Alkylmercury lyase family protein n=1 Tax=Actinokineospora guangxiensis TaxID=1490288 RepID=A0ABW0EME0_9PSEU